MFLIDTHCHLYSSQFDEDREEVLQRAKEAGVQRFLLPNVDLGSLDAMLHLEQKYPEHCFAMLGLHPCSVGATFKEDLQHLEALLKTRSFLAIGEIGMDLYWSKAFIPQQREAFAQQIEWSIRAGIPFVVHARDAFEEIFEVLSAFNAADLKGVFHCFTGGLPEVERILTLGDFYFGIGGVATFKNGGLAEVLPKIPLERIVLETDAPYLAPVPYRGKRNESAYLKYVLMKLSDMLHLSPEYLEALTTSNAIRLFGTQIAQQSVPLSQ